VFIHEPSVSFLQTVSTRAIVSQFRQENKDNAKPPVIMRVYNAANFAPGVASVELLETSNRRDSRLIVSCALFQAFDFSANTAASDRATN
jgi:hypothetical protein